MTSEALSIFLDGAITRIGIHSNQGSHCHFVGLVDGVTNIAKLFWCLAAKPKSPGHVGAVVLPSSPKVNENCGIFLEFGISGLMMGQGAVRTKSHYGRKCRRTGAKITSGLVDEIF